MPIDLYSPTNNSALNYSHVFGKQSSSVVNAVKAVGETLTGIFDESTIKKMVELFEIYWNEPQLLDRQAEIAAKVVIRGINEERIKITMDDGEEIEFYSAENEFGVATIYSKNTGRDPIREVRFDGIESVYQFYKEELANDENGLYKKHLRGEYYQLCTLRVAVENHKSGKFDDVDFQHVKPFFEESENITKEEFQRFDLNPFRLLVKFYSNQNLSIIPKLREKLVLIGMLNKEALNDTDRNSIIQSFEPEMGQKFIDYINKPNVEGWVGYYKGCDTKKDTPYLTATRANWPVSLNGEARFPDSGEQIVCRHLAVQYIKDILTDGKGQGKIDWSHFRTIESLAAHVPDATEQEYKSLKKNAKSYSLIKNDGFGAHIKKCFEKMKESKTNLQALLVDSTNHVMAVRLKIKGEADNPIYVIKFYDPNRTNVTVRYKTSDLATLQEHTLKRYIDGDGQSGLYSLYYPEQEQMTMLTECDLNSFQNGQNNVEQVRSSFESESVTATQIHYLLRHNFADKLKSLKGQLQKMDPDTRYAVLSAKDKDGISGYYFALSNGHAEAIEAFCDLLTLVEEDKRSALLDAKDSNNTPGFYFALRNGHTEAVKAFCKGLKLVPDQYQRFKLLLAESEFGLPILPKLYGLQRAFENEHWVAIKAYEDAARELVSSDQFDQLILAALPDLLAKLVFSIDRMVNAA